MPEAPAIRRKVSALLMEHLNLEVPAEDTDLLKEGMLDSMALVELMARLEGSFGIRITLDDLDIEHFRSVVRIAEFVAAKSSIPQESST